MTTHLAVDAFLCAFIRFAVIWQSRKFPQWTADDGSAFPLMESATM